MDRNWYMVSTKPQEEKEVSEALTKAKIKNYLPIIFAKNKSEKERRPLFSGAVFAYTREYELREILNISGVLNFFYYLGKPATISDLEIETIQEYLSMGYYSISLEKIPRDLSSTIAVVSEPDINKVETGDKVVKTFTKVTLPSIGFALIISNIESGNTGLMTESKPLQSGFEKTLKLTFDSENFSVDEITDIISIFSDLYASIGGDRLEIKGTGIIELIEEPELKYL